MKDKKCQKCNSQNLEIGKAKTVSGGDIFPYYCLDCEEVQMGVYAKKKDAEKVLNIKQVMTRTERGGYLKKEKCAVCGSNEVELHHFAPKHLFPNNYDQWPTAYLCKFHHKQWHDIVTPNMCKKTLDTTLNKV